MQCEKCGNIVSEQDKFCGVCGMALQQSYTPHASIDLESIKAYIMKYKVYIIIACCLMVAVFTMNIVITNNKKNNGYKDCIEEHIREFEMEENRIVYYDTIYYSDAFLEEYALAKEANVTYEQDNIDGECNLKVIAAYDEEMREWFIYNGKTSIPVAKPPGINSEIWGN